MSELKDDNLKDIFSKKFENFESDVNPEIWNAVSKNIPTASGSAGLSILTKILIAGLSVTAISVTYFVSLESNNNDIVYKEPVTVKDDNNLVSKPVVSNDESKETLIVEETEQIASNELNLELTNSANQIEIETSPKPDSVIIVSDNVITVNEEIIVDNFISNEEIITEDIVDEPVIVQNDSESTSEDIVAIDKVDIEPTPLVVPNVFTPNNDGVNDKWFITSEGLNDFSIVILDQKQSIVFKSNSANFEWNGNDMNGNQSKQGYYYFILIAKDINGNTIKESNQLFLQR